MKFECQVVASKLISLTLSLLASCITSAGHVTSSPEIM